MRSLCRRLRTPRAGGGISGGDEQGARVFFPFIIIMMIMVIIIFFFTEQFFFLFSLHLSQVENNTKSGAMISFLSVFGKNKRGKEYAKTGPGEQAQKKQKTKQRKQA